MTFGEYLQELLDKRGLSALSYAQAIGYRRNGFVSNVLNGTRRPPPKKIGEWMQPLRLDADEAALFRELAKSASAKSKRGDRAYIETVETRMSQAELLALLLADALIRNGEKLSQESLKTIEAIRERQKR